MNVVRYNTWRPFEDLMALNHRINHLFDGVYRKNEKETEQSIATWYPPTDIYETDDNYIFKMEIPGVSKDDIKIELDKNSLSIKGTRKKEDVEKDSYHRFESFNGDFSRSFTLPDNINSEKMEASLKNGVLKLTVAKAEEKKPIAIQIN